MVLGKKYIKIVSYNIFFLLFFIFFSPAIPLSKGEPTLPIRSPEDSQTTQSPDSLTEGTPDVDRIGKQFFITILRQLCVTH